MEATLHADAESRPQGAARAYGWAAIGLVVTVLTISALECGYGASPTAYFVPGLTARPMSLPLTSCRTLPAQEEGDQEAKTGCTVLAPTCHKGAKGGRLDVLKATIEWRGDVAVKRVHVEVDGDSDATGAGLHFGSPRGPPGEI